MSIPNALLYARSEDAAGYLRRCARMRRAHSGMCGLLQARRSSRRYSFFAEVSIVLQSRSIPLEREASDGCARESMDIVAVLDEL